MTDTFSVSPALSTLHPLEPLSAEEIIAAVSIVRSERQLGPLVRFVSVTLHEPAPEVALNYKPGDPVTREAFMVLLDKSGESSATYEAIVKGEAAIEPGVPESFNVLIRELQSLCLDVELIKRADLIKKAPVQEVAAVAD